MEKIYFDDTTFIWKTKLNFTKYKEEIIAISKDIIKNNTNSPYDAYGYNAQLKNEMGEIFTHTKFDEVIQLGLNYCKELYKNDTNNIYNKINFETWVNLVRSVNPLQLEFKHEEIKGIGKYHVHTELNKKMESFVPHYTFVYYTQMPDVMDGEDGVLYFRGQNKKEYWIRPEEDDLIIMPADMPHAPNNAPKSTIDRIVLAGNIGFEFIKKEKSLI